MAAPTKPTNMVVRSATEEAGRAKWAPMAVAASVAPTREVHWIAWDLMRFRSASCPYL
jgi:hypothetical protein